MKYEHSGMKNEVIERILSISKRAVKAFSGKGLITFSFVLVCLAAVSGYTVGSQVSMSDSQNSDKGNIMTKVKEIEKQAPFAGKEESAAGAKAKDARYTLSGGAYILKDNLQKNRRFAEMLGLPFQVKEKKKKVKMTRLLVGTFPVDKEKVELKRLEAYTRDAFVIRHGRKVSIYAGSFYYHADASRWKNSLMKQGLNVEEVTAQVEMPLYVSYIGDFETAGEARLAGTRAESAGRKMPIIAMR